MDVGSEHLRAFFRKFDQFLFAFDPAIGGDCCFEESRLVADGVPVDSELDLVFSDEYDDQVVVVVDVTLG